VPHKAHCGQGDETLRIKRTRTQEPNSNGNLVPCAAKTGGMRHYRDQSSILVGGWDT